MPVVALVIVGGAVVKYKGNSSAPSTETANTEENMVLGEKRSYDQNSPPLTEADISAVMKIANTEPPAEAEEEKDSATVTSDNQALNNFNNVYVPTDF